MGTVNKVVAYHTSDPIPFVDFVFSRFKSKKGKLR